LKFWPLMFVARPKSCGYHRRMHLTYERDENGRLLTQHMLTRPVICDRCQKPFVTGSLGIEDGIIVSSCCNVCRLVELVEAERAQGS
jgi:hypothetical protein